MDLWGPHWVTNVVGAGFEAYARLFHPLDDYPGALRWADIARFNGRILHPSAQWAHISAPAPFTTEHAQRGRSHPGEPRWGHLSPRALGALCAVLAHHTTTAQHCFFAVWQGCGTLHAGPGVTLTAYLPVNGVLPDLSPPPPAPAHWQLDLTGPTFTLPGRDRYHLFHGAVEQAVHIGRWDNTTFFTAQSPHFMWPADHTWCVATEIDDDSTIIGGTTALISEVCASAAIEVLPIAPDAPFDDTLNP